MLWDAIQNFFLPTQANVYRPTILRRTSLMIFLSLIFAVEGFLVAGLVARESDTRFLSSALSQTTMQNSASSIMGVEAAVSWGRPFMTQLFTSENFQKHINFILVAIALVLVVLVVSAFLFHVDVQAHDMLLGGIVVAAIALVCLIGNSYFLKKSTSNTASRIQISSQ